MIADRTPSGLPVHSAVRRNRLAFLVDIGATRTRQGDPTRLAEKIVPDQLSGQMAAAVGPFFNHLTCNGRSNR